jgi:hypothetical protein
MTKQMNDKSYFIYVQYYCVCSKNITDWPPSVQHRIHEPYEVSFNITGEYSIKTFALLENIAVTGSCSVLMSVRDGQRLGVSQLSRVSYTR